MHSFLEDATLKEPVGIKLKPLCDLCVLCASVVNFLRKILTTETQSTLRMHRERQILNFPTDSFRESFTRKR